MPRPKMVGAFLCLEDVMTTKKKPTPKPAKKGKK
jgi:hypothetical protein